MQPLLATSAIFALLNLGGGEIILMLSIILILFGSKQLALLARGFGRGMVKFQDALSEVLAKIQATIRRLIGGMDRGSHDAGRSLGGIYGKRAAQAIAPDNQVAELYDPAAFGPRSRPGQRLPKGISSFLARIWLWVRRLTEAIRNLRDKK